MLMLNALVGFGARRRGGLDAVIMALFASGEQGAWYDPSDLSTMFQDSAGTTPVTTDGQPVGLILDKSKGLTLGPELMTNGDFSNGATGWTLSTGWSISAGVASYSGELYTNKLEHTWPGSNNKSYRITATVVMLATPVSGASIYFNFGGMGQDVLVASPLGLIAGNTYHISGIITPTAVSGQFYVRVSSGANHQLDYTLDNISIKEIAGNHASQATAASRPLYKTDGTYHWLQFDGIDDRLVAASALYSPASTIDMWGGTRKQADVPFGCICELAGSPVEPGLWSQEAFYSLRASGNAYLSVAAVPAPHTDVLFGRFTLDTVPTGHKNTVPDSFAAGSVLYAGQYGNMTVQIGNRIAGSVPLNGRIYALIIRGALSSPQEITDTEAWVNGKTGAY